MEKGTNDQSSLARRFRRSQAPPKPRRGRLATSSGTSVSTITPREAADRRFLSMCWLLDKLTLPPT
jgi:hypothetical protein